MSYAARLIISGSRPHVHHARRNVRPLQVVQAWRRSAYAERSRAVVRAIQPRRSKHPARQARCRDWQTRRHGMTFRPQRGRNKS